MKSPVRFIAFLAAAALAGMSTSTQAAEIMVNQKGKKFVPKKVTAKVGDVMVFSNIEKKKIRHNVYSKTPGFEYIKVKIQKPGQSNKIKLTKAGTFEVRCSFHPRMKMKVTVTN